MRKVSKPYLLIVILVLTVLQPVQARKRALTVFVGDYPEDSGWSKIHSSNDKTLILNMLGDLGFKRSDIICLEDSGATFWAISQAFRDLAASCRPGDEVYIHFSSHGQWITDVDGDEALRNPRDHYDESIVPFDACDEWGRNGYTGGSHLVDDTLNAFLLDVCGKVGKMGRVVVVIDACHSGDAHREYSDDDQELFARGTGKRLELPLTGRTCQTLPMEAGCMTISACKEFESNYECEVGGKRYGRLSYAISRVFKPGMTSESLRDGIRETYGSLSVSSPPPQKRTQSPVFSIPNDYKGKRLF